MFSSLQLESPSSPSLSPLPPPPPTKKKKKKNFFRFGFFVVIHLLESSKSSCRVCTLKVIHIFCNVDCATCFTLCRWLLFCILPLLTVWHTVLVSVFPPPPLPTPTPICIFFLFRYGFFVKTHLLESSKLEL